MIEIGKKLPSASLFKVGEKGIDEIDSLEYVSGKKVVLVGVPGAFTPTCSLKQMPGFVKNADEILSKNVDEIIVLNRGEIAESGRHKELMSKKGIYYNLVKMQEI